MRMGTPTWLAQIVTMLAFTGVAGLMPFDGAWGADKGGLSAKLGGSNPAAAPRKRPAPRVLLHEESTDGEQDTPAAVKTPKYPSAGKTAGQLTVSYTTPKNKALKEIARWLSESKGFDDIVNAINESFKVPPIKVVFGECGQANAFYDSEAKQITMCYELFAYLKERFAEDDLSEEEVIVKTVNGGVFTFFHELGHAFVDVFDLPITGKEEDAVDDLATLILLQADEEDEDGTMVSDATDSFWLDLEEELDEGSFWGEHSLNGQRAGRMVCMAYGSDPEKFSEWVGTDGLPKERAESCRQEYERMAKGWNALLTPHVVE